MRRLLPALYVLLTGPAWAAHAGDGVPEEEPAPLALGGLDPIHLIEGREVPGLERFNATDGRFRYRFEDAEHLALFEDAPGRYAVQGEGTCAVMPGYPASPELFLVHEGRIFGFGSPRCLASFRDDPESYLEARKNVAILLFEGVELLDFAGPGEVFSRADRGRAFLPYTVAAAAGPVTSQGFVTVTPQYTFDDCPRPDIVIVPGGATRIPASDPAVIDWLRETSAEAEVVLSVCTGSLLLAEAGLLDGLEATTHANSLDRLAEAAPAAEVVRDRRFVDNGKVVTSAGIAAGIDAALHVVGRLLGPEASAETAEVLEIPWDTGRVDGSE